MQDDLERLHAEIAAALAGLTVVQTQATPSAGSAKWSIQQIVDHLSMTYRFSAPAIQTRIDKGTPTRAKPTLQQRAAQFFLISAGQFPRGREAPAAVQPVAGAVPLSGAELHARVRGELEELDRVTTEAERAFGRGRCVSHMILGPLSMAQWRRFHLIHGRHHMKQIWKIREDRGFRLGERGRMEDELDQRPSGSSSSSTRR